MANENKPFTYTEHRNFCRLFGLKPRNPISWLLWKAKKKWSADNGNTKENH